MSSYPVRTDLVFILFIALAQVTPLFAATRPNVLFITADDLGPQLSCYGNTAISTPHLDRLAKRGTRFEIAYVAQASCSPSRSAMFTGLYPHANGQYGLMGRTDAPSGFALHEQLRDKTNPAYLKRVSGYYNTIKRLDVGIGMLMEELRKAGHADDTLIIFRGDHGPPFARGKTSVYEI